MKPMLIIDGELARRDALKLFLEPEYQVLECVTVGQVGSLPEPRNFRAVFLAWTPGLQDTFKAGARIPCITDYIVLVLLMPRDFTQERVKAEAEAAARWAAAAFPQAQVKFIPRLAARDIQLALSAILARPTLALPDWIGTDPELQRVLRLATRLAQSEQPLLITGEPGTGKQTLARWIHLRSARGTAGAPFEIYRWCPGMDPALAVSMLCGYESGAFPWAAKGRPGSLQAADTGTLYIDELSVLPPQAQLQLVKILENPLQGVERLGSDGSHRVDVRIIAGSRKAIDSLSGDKITEDLLNHFQYKLHLPPLRSRVGDIPALAEHFLLEAGSQVTASAPVLGALQRYPWPTNLDELRQVLQEALLRAEDQPEILFEHLPARIQHVVARAA